MAETKIIKGDFEMKLKRFLATAVALTLGVQSVFSGGVTSIAETDTTPVSHYNFENTETLRLL